MAKQGMFFGSAGNRPFLVPLLIVLLSVGTGCDAEGGNATGWLTPGQMYDRALTYEGLGINTVANSWYHKAAEAGHPIAPVELGFLYRYGHTGFLRNPDEARRWFLQVAQEREPTVFADFINRYEADQPDVVLDAQEAERWFRSGVASCHAAAARGDLEAQTLLGGLYGAGAGVAQDRATALSLWQDAAEQGYTPAQLILGRLYWYEKSYDKAHPWLMKAAVQGLPEAEYLLSDLYQFGRNVEFDYQEALRWLRQAADHGFELARRQLQSMEAQGLL